VQQAAIAPVDTPVARRDDAASLLLDDPALDPAEASETSGKTLCRVLLHILTRGTTFIFCPYPTTGIYLHRIFYERTDQQYKSHDLTPRYTAENIYDLFLTPTL
jgi:hypothetical protein